MLEFGQNVYFDKRLTVTVTYMALICSVMVRELHFSTREIFPQSTVVSMDFILVEVHNCSGRASKINLLSGEIMSKMSKRCSCRKQVSVSIEKPQHDVNGMDENR